MGMDLIRSCYTTFMRFWKDDPTEVKVRWFFCDGSAKIFPGHHLFGSGNWASDRFDWPGPGEVLDAPRVWDNGRPIAGLIGQHFCGPVASYREGTTWPGVPLDGFADGRCACCAPVPPRCDVAMPRLPNLLRANTTLVETNVSPAIWTFASSSWSGAKDPLEFRWVLTTLPPLDSGAPCFNTIEMAVICVDNQVMLWNGWFGRWVPFDTISFDPLVMVCERWPILGSLCTDTAGQQEVWRVVITEGP